MPARTTLTGTQVSAAVLSAGLLAIDDAVAEKLAGYGNLLLKWNDRTNLTGVTDTETLLQRHLVESIAAAQALPAGKTTVLDYGSGAGLPGIPVSLCRPELEVTLAESQQKKVGFLREAKRSFDLRVDVFAGRVAQMPQSKQFDLVTMRAVDKMEELIAEALGRVAPGGWLVLFMTPQMEGRFIPNLGVGTVERMALPTVGHLLMFHVEQNC